MVDVRDRRALAGTPARDTALACVEAGIEAAHPERVVADAVDLEDGTLRIAGDTYDLTSYERVVVLGGGNAAAHVASALSGVLGDRLDGGVVVTDDPVDVPDVTVLQSDHPVPSERGVEATAELLDAARGCGADTLVLAVVTGGGSAVMPAPASGLSLADVQATTEALLRSGAPIQDVNAVRKHCSAVKGGRLARALAPATVATLVFSDVVGNDLDVIASGPTVPDTSTYGDALGVLDEYGVDVPDAVRAHLEAGARGDLPETPSEGDAAFENVQTHVLADGSTALDAARAVADERGYDTLVLSASIEGEAREVGGVHGAIGAEVRATGDPVEPPAVVLSGGELTVTVSGDGEGGPNQECALAAAHRLPDGAAFACVDTDGIDGVSEYAGAVVDVDTVADADAARAALRENDAGGFLAGRNALLETGPTGTNVNDLRVLVVEA
ncbi:MAG: glycerate kinase [Halobacterium sp.]